MPRHQSQSTRDARLLMADSRALEEEAERENPINPHSQLDREAPRYDGSGATPSMGLSTKRGGGTKKGQMRLTARKAYEPKKEESDDEAHEMGLHLGKHLMKLHGSGYHAKFMKGMGMSGCGESGAYEGMGNLTITHEGSGLLGRTQKMEGKGMLGRTRMVGAGRKPNARAAVVKKVMADRGVSMIEASKIVKAEGLY